MTCTADPENWLTKLHGNIRERKPDVYSQTRKILSSLFNIIGKNEMRRQAKIMHG